MLTKSTRKKLLEHNWIDFKERESNPYQSQLRIKRQCRQAMRDLALIVKKIPNEELFEVFDEGIINDLITSLLYHREENQWGKKILTINAELASVFAGLGIYACLNEFQITHKGSPNTVKPIIERLENTFGICKEIGDKSRLARLQKESLKNNQKYICRLSDFENDEIGKFKDYLKELKIPPFDYGEIETIAHNVNHKEIVVLMDIFGENYSLVNIGKIRLNIDFEKNICVLSYKSARSQDDYIRKELVIKKSGKDHILLKKGN